MEDLQLRVAQSMMATLAVQWMEMKILCMRQGKVVPTRLTVVIQCGESTLEFQ